MTHDKFKAKESELRGTLPPSPFYAIRMDGRAFHTFTRQFKAPYSIVFMEAMNNAGLIAATKVLAETELFYVQSDEITLIVKPKNNGQFSFGGRTEKVLSLTSSAATAGFMSACPEVEGFPIFDSRILLLEDNEEVIEYLDWRRLDARKNSITMAAQYLYGDKPLKGKSTRERLEMLEGTEFEKLPYDFYFGRIGHKVTRPKKVQPPNQEPFFVDRTVWEMTSAFQDTTREIVESI